MSLKRIALLGAVAATVATTGIHAAGGLTSLYQMMFKQGGTSAVSRTARSKVSDFVSVKDFGATGDGVTNDTVAVTAAIAYSGDFVNTYFPCPGSYQTTTWGTIPCGYQELVSATGAVPRPLGLKVQESLSAKDFGAKGDGVTDDTTAIGNLVNAAVGTQLINFPCPGTYISSTYGTLACGVYYPPLSATGAVLRPVATKLLETVSVTDFGADPTGSADSTTAFNNAIALAGNATVYIPQGTYKLSSAILCTGATALRGNGMDRNDPPTVGTILTFTHAGDGLQLGGNCTVENLSILTTNAGAGIALRLSGLVQRIQNIAIGKSGTGLWSKAVQGLGPVSTTLENVYTLATGVTTGVDLVPNGTNAVGNFDMVNCEIRSTTTGVHLGGTPGALSVTIVGGAIENNGTTGILADGANQVLTILSTHFEQNTTDDIKWTTGGDLSIFGAVFVTGTTNAINCPNTSCTARVRVSGAVGNAGGAAVILGTTVGASFVGNSAFRGGAFTIGTSSSVTRWGNSTLDGTAIQNFVVDDGSGNAKINFTGAAGASQATLQTNTGNGNFYFFNNGTEVMQMDSAGKLKITTGINGSGTGVQHKRVAGCATAASLAATCTTSVSWGANFADTSYTAVCVGDLITSGVPINGGLTAKAVGSVTFQTVSATAAAAQYTSIDCWAAHD